MKWGSLSMDVFENVNKPVARDEPVEMIYFTKTFGKVIQQRLIISKLKCPGVSGQVPLRTGYWLRNRKQRTGIDGQFSQWR